MTRPQDPVPAPVTPKNEWCVLVEEHTHSDGTNWIVSDIRSFPTREAAQLDGAMMARKYQPRHPMSERGRRIMRTGEDVWTVLVEGRMKTYHFRLTVAKEEQP
ncbi:MAG: hypothetical protein ABW224_18225 [Kibdelosporangium sp.]